jgi:hypothetical protein
VTTLPDCDDITAFDGLYSQEIRLLRGPPFCRRTYPSGSLGRNRGVAVPLPFPPPPNNPRLSPHSSLQCSGSMTFLCGSGSGSAGQYLWLMDTDSDPDPAIFVIDLQDAN